MPAFCWNEFNFTRVGAGGQGESDYRFGLPGLLETGPSRRCMSPARWPVNDFPTGKAMFSNVWILLALQGQSHDYRACQVCTKRSATT